MPPKGYRVGLEKRFWAKVDRRGDNECWVWTGHRLPKGYGHFRVDGGLQKAHRVSYELHKGPIPEGHVVCHSCDNPPCVNPAHLWSGTAVENNADRDKKGRHVRSVGSKHGMATLTEEQVLQIRALAAAGHTRKTIGAQFGITRFHLHEILTRRTWKHI